jgi:hypothetical protein
MSIYVYGYPVTGVVERERDDYTKAIEANLGYAHLCLIMLMLSCDSFLRKFRFVGWVEVRNPKNTTKIILKPLKPISVKYLHKINCIFYY